MLYVSTRGGGKPQRFSGILLEGLAADGGLYVPERFPAADLGRWRALSYPQLATAILSQFMDDVPELAATGRAHRDPPRCRYEFCGIAGGDTAPGVHICVQQRELR